jgi:hypothetical protein
MLENSQLNKTQRKSLQKNFKKHYIKNKKKFLKRFSQKRIFKKFKRSFQNYRYFMNDYYVHIYVVVKPNNIFFGMHNSRDLKNTKILSSTTFRKKITKKKIKKNLIFILEKFLEVIDKSKAFKNIEFVIFSLIIPRNLRKKTLRQIRKSLIQDTLQHRRIIINVKSLKTFNGCTVKKQRKKKRKGFRILK